MEFRKLSDILTYECLKETKEIAEETIKQLIEETMDLLLERNVLLLKAICTDPLLLINLIDTARIFISKNLEKIRFLDKLICGIQNSNEKYLSTLELSSFAREMARYIENTFHYLIELDSIKFLDILPI